MNKLYLSAPMTGLPDFNRPAMNEAARLLRQAGFTVFNPAELGIDDWRSAMKECIKSLPEYDTLVQFNDWSKSRGARLENLIATSIGMEICQWEIMRRHLVSIREAGELRTEFI